MLQINFQLFSAVLDGRGWPFYIEVCTLQSHTGKRVPTRNNFMLMWQKFHVFCFSVNMLSYSGGSSTHFHYQLCPKTKLYNIKHLFFMFLCGVESVGMILKPSRVHSFMTYSILLWCRNLCSVFEGSSLNLMCGVFEKGESADRRRDGSLISAWNMSIDRNR